MMSLEVFIMGRKARVYRVTDETEISVEVDLDGVGKVEVDTPLKFLNHMLHTFGQYASMDMKVNAKGDLNHHIVEDTAIVLGMALDRALGERSNIKRFGSAIVPMDDALVIISLDLKRRSYYSINLNLEGYIEDVFSGDLIHFLRSLASNTVITLHVHEMAGYDSHHKIEAVFKGLGMAFRDACRLII